MKPVTMTSTYPRPSIVLLPGLTDEWDPALCTNDWIAVSSSAGKDSQAMLDVIVRSCDAQHVPRAKIVVIHADLGRVEWEGTRELAALQARHYGLRFEIVARPQGDLLEHVEARGMWPDPKNRYCTSDHKRGQIHKVFTRLAREVLYKPCRILDCMGLRAEESPNRSKMKPFEFASRASNGQRHVDRWLPIHTWTTDEVWEVIKASGVPHHPAYDLGMPRLSCCICIFAPRAAVEIAGRHNRKLLDTYIALEERMGHTFKHPDSDWQLRDVRDAIERGDEPPESVASWLM